MKGLSRQVLSLVPSLALAMFANNKLQLTLNFLSGIRCYFPSQSVPSGLQGRPAKSSKKQKYDNDVDLGGAESLSIVNLTKREIGKLDFYAEFDIIVVLMLMTLFNVLLGETLQHFGRPVDHLTLALSLVCVIGSVWVLLKVDLFSAYTSGTDKVYAVFFGVLSFIVALVSLTMVPARLLGFDVEAAADILGPLLVELIKNRSNGVEDIPPVAIPASAMQLGLAGAAGLISMVLFAPTLRFVRAYWLQHNLPGWASSQIWGGGALKFRFTLHLLLPLAAALLWWRPVSDMLAMAPRELLLLQGGALIVTALAQASNVRSLVQRFADSSLTAWYQLKHGAMSANKESRVATAKLIRLKCGIVYTLIAKAAVQSMAPATLFLGLGIMQLYCALHPGMMESADANGMLQSMFGFLAWWAGSAWFVFCALELWLFRTGTLKN